MTYPNNKYLPNTCAVCLTIIRKDRVHCELHAFTRKCTWCGDKGYKDDPIVHHSLGEFNIMIHDSEFWGDEAYWRFWHSQSTPPLPVNSPKTYPQ